MGRTVRSGRGRRLPVEMSGWLQEPSGEKGIDRQSRNSHRRGLNQDELRALLRWQSGGLPSNPPPPLQGPWKAELVSRVITRIEDHFAKRGQPSPVAYDPSKGSRSRPVAHILERKPS